MLSKVQNNFFLIRRDEDLYLTVWIRRESSKARRQDKKKSLPVGPFCSNNYSIATQN